jgi:glycerophosphoryl diester phosphodiesterase
LSRTLHGEAPLVIAHRGASGHRPENTLPAFALAVDQGADMIETDLHRTRDGAVVVAHDEDLAGLGGRGEIVDATLEEVRALDAGGGERVPTLDELLDRFGARIPFNLELKRATRSAYDGLEREALAAVEQRGLLDRTLFSSFYDPVLARLRALAPAARIGLLLSRRFPRDLVARARALGAEAVHPEASLVDGRLVEEAHGAGLRVFVFTVDEEAEMSRLLALGVDGLFTNVPDRMRALIDPAGVRRPAASRTNR